ncbi:MAG: 2,4'-dihydroxyacetophenone dioxygenase [Flavobacterium sp.]|jgi:2,4'-dihydroxyacetophenone dioxygenase
MSDDSLLEKIQHEAQTGMVPNHAPTEAVHIGESDLPFVDLGDGSKLQLLQVDLNQGLWVVRTRFPAGYAVNKHYHTGPVFAVTFSGCWYYKEYPDYQNTKGSYLYEPAHSIHTLIVSEDNTEETDVWFSIYGANVNVDEDNNVIGVTDAQSILTAYQGLCEAQGLNFDKLIIKR